MKSKCIIVLFLYLTVAISVSASTYALVGNFVNGELLGQIRTFQENGKIGVLLECYAFEPAEAGDDARELIVIDPQSEPYVRTDPVASDYPQKYWIVISPEEITDFVSMLDRLIIAFNQILRGEEDIIDISFDGFSTCMVADIENEDGFVVRKSECGNGIIITDFEGEYCLYHTFYMPDDKWITFSLCFYNPNEISDLRDKIINIVWGESF